jgi:hypothetical protein
MKDKNRKMEKSKLWFRAKNYGWGWYPCSWEGWVVLLTFIGLLLLNVFYFDFKVSSNSEPTTLDLTIFFGILIILIIILLWICYKNGERPRWRWGR